MRADEHLGQFISFGENSPHWFQGHLKSRVGPRCPKKFDRENCFPSPGKLGWGLVWSETLGILPFELGLLLESLVSYFSDLEMEKYLKHSKCFNP